MDINSILNSDGYHIKNPYYKEGNGQPEYLIGENPTSNIRTTADLFMEAAQRGDLGVIGKENDYEKYIKAGITPSKFEDTLQYDKILADRQSNWSKLFNALGQTVVSEVGLGTLGAFADMFDFVASNILGIGEANYSNKLGDSISELQERFREEIMPIYTDPTLNIQNGGLKDFGWWMNNMPQIASSFTLLIPARGLTLGVGKLAKLLGGEKAVSSIRRWAGGAKRASEGKKLSKFNLAVNDPLKQLKREQLYKTASDAVLMRTMENYQESGDVHTQTYDEALDRFSHMSNEEFKEWTNKNKNLLDDDVDTSDRNEVAKNIAKKAADRTFAMDFSNVIFDIIQLHGLRNIGRVKNLGLRGGGARVQEAQAKSIQSASEYAGRAIDESTKNISKFKKGLNYTKNATLGIAKTALEESTEGIEEAVNYIAQQEGLTYGKALLDGKDDNYKVVDVPTAVNMLTLGIPGIANVFNTWNKLQNPLHSYLGNAQLQESAFWGFLGGMVFGVGGNVLNRTQLAHQRKQLKKAREINPVTGEKRDNTTTDNESWLDMLLMPDQEAAITAIKSRDLHRGTLVSELEDINNGKNPWIKKNNESDEKADITTNEEAELLRIRALDKYKTQLVLDAKNSGTFDMLMAYWESDGNKAALEKIRSDNENNSREISSLNVDNEIKEFSEFAKHISDLYDEQSATVMAVVEELNAGAKDEDRINLSTVQQIAKNNTDRMLEAEHYDRELQALNDYIAREEATQSALEEGRSDTPTNFEEERQNIRLQHLITLYAYLDAQKKELEKNKDKDWNTNKTLENIKRRQQRVLNELKQTTTLGKTSLSMSSVVAATLKYASGTSFIEGKDGKPMAINKKEARSADEEVLKQAKTLLADSTEYLEDDVILDQAKTILDTIESKKAKTDLYNKNHPLWDAYHQYQNVLENKITVLDAVATDLNRVKEEASYYNNCYNTARQKLIEDADNTIISLYKKYDGIVTEDNDPIFTAILKARNSDVAAARELAKSVMTEEEANKFIKSLEVLNLSNRSNQALVDHLVGVIGMAKQDIRASKKKDSASSETISDDEISDTDTSLEESKESTDGQNEGTGDNPEGSTMPVIPQTRTTTKLKLLINNRGNLSNIKRANNNNGNVLQAFDNGDGTFELDTSNLSGEEQRRYQRAGLLEAEEDVDIVRDKTQITKNPIVKENKGSYKLVTPGTISKVVENPENPTTEVEPEVASTEEPIVDTESSSEEPEEETKEGPKTESKSDDGIFSTGVDEQTKHTIPTQPVVEDFTKDNERALNIRINNEFESNIESLQTLTKDKVLEIKERVINSILNGDKLGFSDEQIRKKINDVVNRYFEIIDNTEKLSNDLQKKTYALSTFANESRREEVEVGISENYFRLFSNTVDSFIKEYSKLVTLGKTDDGRIRINRESILRCCNNISNSVNGSVGNNLYSILNIYLNSEEGRKKYIIEDNRKTAERIIQDAALSQQQIIDRENDTESTEERVNIYDNIKFFNETPENVNSAKYFQTLDSLQVGDTLTMVSERVNGKLQLTFKKGDVTIGNMPMPNFVNDTFIVYNKALVTDVRIDDKGQIISNSKQLLESLFLGTTQDHANLRDILSRYEFEKDNSKLLNEFLNNPIISQLISDEEQKRKTFRQNHNKGEIDPTALLYVDETKGYKVDSDILLEMLSRLWRYSSFAATSINPQSNANAIRYSLESWFKSRYNTYNRVRNLIMSVNNETEVTISKMSDGQIIKAYETTKEDNRVTEDKYKLTTYPSDSIVDRSNAKLSIVDSNSKLIVSEFGTFDIPTIYSTGRTVLTVFGRNKQPDYVQAVGCVPDFGNTEKSNNTYKELIAAIGYQLRRSINSGDMNDIYNTFSKIFEQGSGFGILRNKNGRILLGLQYMDTKAGSVPYVHISFIEPNESPDDRGNYKNHIKIFPRTKYNKGLAYEIRIDGKYKREEALRGGINNIVQEGINYAYRTPNKNDIIRDILSNLSNLVIKNCSINISKQGILADINKTEYGGFFSKNGDTVSLDIPNGEGSSFHIEGASYNDLLLYNNLVRVNLQKINGKNFSRRDNNQLANQTLCVSLPKIINQNTSTTRTTTSNSRNKRDVVESTTDVERRNKIKSLIETQDSNTNVTEEIFKASIGEEEYNRFRQAFRGFQDYNEVISSLFPSNLSYNPKINFYNSKGESIGVNAYTRGKRTNKVTYSIFDDEGKKVTATMKKAENTIIGPRLLNMLSDEKISRRKQGIRKLIHEQLHSTIQDNPERKKELLKVSKEVFKDFWNYVKSNYNKADKNSVYYNIADTLNLIDISGSLKPLNRVKTNTLYEEFLVETITNPVFINVLNSIEVENTQVSKKENLFTKIIKALAEFFGWSIKDNTLYAKEINMLAEIVSDNTTPVEESNETEQVKTKSSNTKQEDNESLELKQALDSIETYDAWQSTHTDFDKETHTYSVDGVDLDKSVTGLFDSGNESPDEDYGFAGALGNTIDAMTRDYFLHSPEYVGKTDYPNMNDKRKKQVLKELARFKELLDKRYPQGYKVLTNEMRLVADVATEKGTVSVGGTMDMLIVDNDGNLHIYDMKNKRWDIDRKLSNGKTSEDRERYTFQLNAYRQILETLIPEFKGKVKDLHLIWFNQEYESQGKVLRYTTDENDNVSVIRIGTDKVTPIAEDNSWVTPHFKKNIEDSIVNLEIKDVLTNVTVYEPKNEDDSNVVDYSDVFEDDADESSVEEINTEAYSLENENSYYSSEMQQIKDQAIANGTFMKAPNDNPTNLNEKQWLIVRTKAFKDWFGDWENNPNEASKVVDENGEPLVVYHSGPEGINVFRDELYEFEIPTGIPNAIYTSDNKHVSGSYILTFDDLIDDGTNEDDYYLEKRKSKSKTKTYDLFSKIKNPLIIDAKGAKWNEINWNNKIVSTRDLEAEIRMSDYDGVIIKNVIDIGFDPYNDDDSQSTIYIQFNPNQIKSATDNIGEFSRENNDIYASSVEELRDENVISIINIDSFTEQLPDSIQTKFKEFKNNGKLNYRCN